MQPQATLTIKQNNHAHSVKKENHVHSRFKEEFSILNDFIRKFTEAISWELKFRRDCSIQIRMIDVQRVKICYMMTPNLQVETSVNK